ncbi:MAG: hypothetical protein OIN84_06455, partial [Candidatus Methanoperedens sp.]|nr:hypothetical protein [Candidatus Methanoperedens sp.]
METFITVLQEQLNFLAANPVLTAITLLSTLVAVLLIMGLIWYQSTRQKALSDRRVALILALAIGLIMLNYFFPGDFIRGDGTAHTARVWLMKDLFVSGELPIWTNRWYLGYPQEMYYGPIFYMTSALMATIVNGDVFLSVRIVLWILHIMSGVLMYLYVRTRFTHHAPAILAAVAYVLSWQHFGIIRRFGVMPLALFYVLIPIFFLLLENYRKGKSSFGFTAIAGGVLFAIAVLSHIQYAVYLCATYLVVLGWIAFSEALYRDWSAVRRTLLLIAGTSVTAALLGGWFIVPSALERNYILTVPAVFDSLTLQGIVDATLNVALITRLLDSYGQGYVGLSILALALGAMIFALRRYVTMKETRNKHTLANAYPFVVAGLGFILLDPMRRYTSIWFFFVCVVAAYGSVWLINRIKVSRPSLVYQLIAAAFLLEMGPALLLVGELARFDNLHDNVSALQAEVASSGVPGRILVLKPNREVFWRSEDAINTGASVVFGTPMESATKVHDYLAAIVNQFAVEVLDRHEPISDTSMALLRLANIRYVILEDETVIEIPNATPVLFSPSIGRQLTQDVNGIVGMQSRSLYEDREINSDYVNEVASEMHLDPHNPTANTFLLDQQSNTNDEISGIRQDECDSETLFTFQAAVERHTSVSFDYTACQPGNIRLSYAYFPLLR